jgi:hypothetical protein
LNRRRENPSLLGVETDLHAGIVVIHPQRFLRFAELGLLEVTSTLPLSS